jgi:alkylation response protein AidB-like acyl-CoA dehydrogenase
MNFDFTDDQREIKRTARELLASRSPFEKVREASEKGAYDEALWRELCELGWPGIAVAEEHGGQGLGAVELSILLEELGFAVAASPFLATALAATAIEHAGSAAQKEQWLPRLATGETTGGFGTPSLCIDAGDAAVTVVVDDGALRLVEAGAAEITPFDSIDGTRRFARIAGDAGAPLEGDASAVLDRANAAVAAELVGVCQRALDMTLEYVKERKQFGVPVGSFQAVGHRCAEMLRGTESARSAAYYAAWAADAAPERLAEAAALAKAAASEAGREVTASAIQAHGGIGFTWEADVHWLYKRAQLDAAFLGAGKAHRARLARLVAAQLAGSAV